MFFDRYLHFEAHLHPSPRRFMSAFRRAVGVALALRRGEGRDRGRLVPAVLADIALLLSALVERMASLARAVRMPLAKRRRQTIHRRRLVPAVLAVEVLHRCGGHGKHAHGTNEREPRLVSFKCIFLHCILLF